MNWKRTAAILLTIATELLLSACGITAHGSIDIPSAVSAGKSEQTVNPSMTTAATEAESVTGNGILVVYFSCTGNTKTAAQTIADAANGTLYEITPAQPYTDADLNYNDDKSRTSIEQNDKSARPEISGTVENWEQYDTVFIGYPIWWGTAPRILDTFVESYDFTGKTVIPFCTSAASDIGSSGTDLKKLASGKGTWLDGKRLTADVSGAGVSAWLTELGIN
jgi:flavodoxin